MAARLAQGGRLLGAWPAWLAAAGLAAGAGVAWLISQADPDQGTIPDVPLALPVAVLVGWSLIGSGLLAARSRREDHLALALIFTGSVWLNTNRDTVELAALLSNELDATVPLTE